METTLISAERLNNSVNGNPRYRLHTTDGFYLTSSDSACAYDVQNILGSVPWRVRANERIPVALSLTRAGRVWDITLRGTQEDAQGAVGQAVPEEAGQGHTGQHRAQEEARLACMARHPAGKGRL